MAEALVGVCLMIGNAVELRRKLAALLNVVEGEPALASLARISALLVAEIGLLERRLGKRLRKWRSRGLSMVGPDIALTVVVERAVQIGMRVGSGELRIDGAAVEKVGVGIAAVTARALAEPEAGATKLVIPDLAAKRVGVPAAHAATMALVHLDAREEKGVIT